MPGPEPLRAHDFTDGALSIAVFGPGHGEGILMRFPDGSVGIVDGSGEKTKNEVLRVARELAPPKVHFAALTHPHDDHLLGLAEVIAELTPDELWYSGADHPRMYRKLVQRLRAAERDVGENDPQAKQSDRLTTLIKTMFRHKRTGWGRPRELTDRQVHLRADLCGHRFRIRSLLPTSVSKLTALRAHPLPRTPTLPDLEQLDSDINDLSAALLIEWGTTRVLLGGDAEIGSTHRGWRAAELPDHIDVLKVPHHASSGAYHEETWASRGPKVAIVTPYQHASGSQPPQPAALDRFAQHAARVYLTSEPEWKSSRELAPVSGRRQRPLHTRNPHGCVLVTTDAASNCTVNLFGGAFQYK